jgi:hypothetical protein
MCVCIYVLYTLYTGVPLNMEPLTSVWRSRYPRWSNGSVLVIGYKVRGFKPCRGRWDFEGDKIRSTTFFRREAKLSVSCCGFMAFLRPLRVWKRFFIGKIQYFLLHVPRASLLDSSALTIAREHRWTNRNFSLVDIIPSWLSIIIYYMGDEQWPCWWPQIRYMCSFHGHEYEHGAAVAAASELQGNQLGTTSTIAVVC